jgi:hypothetical protein
MARGSVRTFALPFPSCALLAAQLIAEGLPNPCPEKIDLQDTMLRAGKLEQGSGVLEPANMKSTAEKYFAGIYKMSLPTP